jgi:S1-C subfamily serine protease
LLVGDIITRIGRAEVRVPDDIFAALTGTTVGKPIDVELMRGGKPQTVQVTVGERK